VELFENIRRDRRDRELSVRTLAVKYGGHRQAPVSSMPPARKPAQRNCKVLGPWKPWTGSVLAADLSGPPKQRHTARRIWQRLAAEHGAHVAESTVRA